MLDFPYVTKNTATVLYESYIPPVYYHGMNHFLFMLKELCFLLGNKNVWAGVKGFTHFEGKCIDSVLAVVSGARPRRFTSIFDVCD